MIKYGNCWLCGVEYGYDPQTKQDVLCACDLNTTLNVSRWEKTRAKELGIQAQKQKMIGRLRG